MKTSATNKKVRELITGIRERTLVPRPEFQRRLVWRNADKVNFIQTVLNGYPFPEIYIADGDVDLETGIGTQILVDGQQRVTTLYQYFTASEELKLPSNLPPYAKISAEEQRAFLGYDVATRDLGSVPKANIIEVFRRINMTSYALNAMEINNAVYEGELKKFADHVCDKDFFERHKIFTPTDLKRMGDVRYVLTIVVTMMVGYFNRDELLQESLEQNNEQFDRKDEIDERLSAVLSFIEDARFSEKSRLWKKVDFFSALIEIDRLLSRKKLQISPDAARDRLEAFYLQVDSASAVDNEAEEARYYRAVLQASNDRVSRLRRGEILERILTS